MAAPTSGSDTPGALVSAAWLCTHLRACLVVDCRHRLADPAAGRRLYAAGHIPGAVFADLDHDLSGPKGPHGGRHPLPAPAALAAALSGWGVGAETMVVAYDDQLFAARCWWLLRYLGHDRVAVLDGGLPAWLDAGGALTAEEPRRAPCTFTPRVRAAMAVDVDGVRRLVARGAVLVDSRAPGRYRGTEEPIDRVAGRIPGAVNLPAADALRGDGRWKAAAAQARRFALIPPHVPVIAYCGSGVTACVNVLAMEVAGLPPALLYPGSYSDWISYPDSPVARG